MVSIIFAGVGGQGVVTAANTIGKAAVLEGKPALMTELHGMAQRGGRISVELRIGPYKSAIIPNGGCEAIVGFEEMETARNVAKLIDSGIILLNSRRIHPLPLIRSEQEYPTDQIERILRPFKIFHIEADHAATELGNKRVVNSVMLGALYSTGLLEIEEGSIMKVIDDSFNLKYRDVNKKAFEFGKTFIEPNSIKSLKAV